MPSRPEPSAAAASFLALHYAGITVHAAFLAGSVVTGSATSTSDLDLVVVAEHPDAPFRASYLEKGWPIEVFTHTPASCRRYFQSDARRRQPSLATMCATGTVLYDGGMASGLQAEAAALLAAGPEPLTELELCRYRYVLTDLLDDLEGAHTGRRSADLFLTVALLLQHWPGFVLGTRRHWGGQGKWALRQLERCDPGLAAALVDAIAAFWRQGDPGPLVALVETSLAPYGGRLFAGFREAGRRE